MSSDHGKDELESASIAVHTTAHAGEGNASVAKVDLPEDSLDDDGLPEPLNTGFVGEIGEDTGWRSTYVTKQSLLDEFMLSASWIARLGEPDKLEPNPHYRKAAPMKLWLRSRVEEFLAEREDEYLERISRWQKRSLKFIAIAERKRQDTLEWARTVDIRLSKATLQDIRGRSRRFLSYRGESSADVSDRHIVNTVRHEFTNYHSLLDQLGGRFGCYPAYCILRRRINEAICQKYGIACTPENTGDMPEIDSVLEQPGEAKQEAA